MDVLHHVINHGTREKATICSACNELGAKYAIGYPSKRMSFSSCDKPECIGNAMEQLIGCGCKSEPHDAAHQQSMFEYRKFAQGAQSGDVPKKRQSPQVVAIYPFYKLTTDPNETTSSHANPDPDDMHYSNVFLTSEQGDLESPLQDDSAIPDDYTLGGKYNPATDELFASIPSSTSQMNVGYDQEEMNDPILIGRAVSGGGSSSGFRTSGTGGVRIVGSVGGGPRRFTNSQVYVSKPQYQSRPQLEFRRGTNIDTHIRRIPPGVRPIDHWKGGRFLRPSIRRPQISWSPGWRRFGIRRWNGLGDNRLRGRLAYFRTLLSQRRQGIFWSARTWTEYYALLAWYATLGYNVPGIYNLIPDEDIYPDYYDYYGDDEDYYPQTNVTRVQPGLSLGVGVPGVSLFAGI